MYTIGEFSLISSMTVKTLRHYHKKGLLIPSFVNRDNGYRYYSGGDVERAKVIVTLKGLRFSLGEIEKLMEDMNDDVDVIDALQRKKSQIDIDIESLKDVSSAIDIVVAKEREANKMMCETKKIEIKTIPKQLVVAMRWRGPYSDTGHAIGRLYRAGGRHGAGQPFNLYYDGEHKEIADVESCLPLKKQIKSKLDCRPIPEQKCVSLVHKGSYESLGESYRAVFDYMKKNGLTMNLPTREVYIKGPGMIFKGNSDNYLTEILIPVG